MTQVFDGITFSAKQDGSRLKQQLAKVKHVMADGEWRTLRQLSQLVNAPEASVSARLRDLRKARFGACTVDRRRVRVLVVESRHAAPRAIDVTKVGVHEYRLRYGGR
jgi:hypothetical protein